MNLKKFHQFLEGAPQKAVFEGPAVGKVGNKEKLFNYLKGTETDMHGGESLSRSVETRQFGGVEALSRSVETRIGSPGMVNP